MSTAPKPAQKPATPAVTGPLGQGAQAGDSAQPEAPEPESAEAAPKNSEHGLIGHERRRELRERPVKGSAVIDGSDFNVFDWNSSGICLSGYDGPLKKQDRTLAQVKIEVPENKFDFNCELIIVRRDIARKLIAGVFVTLERGDRVAIASHFEALERKANEGLRAAIVEKK